MLFVVVIVYCYCNQEKTRCDVIPFDMTGNNNDTGVNIIIIIIIPTIFIITIIIVSIIIVTIELIITMLSSKG